MPLIGSVSVSFSGSGSGTGSGSDSRNGKSYGLNNLSIPGTNVESIAKRTLCFSTFRPTLRNVVLSSIKESGPGVRYNNCMRTALLTKRTVDKQLG